MNQRAVCLLSVVAVSLPSFAQEETVITVQGPNRKPLAGAVVAVVPLAPEWAPDSAAPVELARTDERGIAHLKAAPGIYSVTLSAVGVVAEYHLKEVFPLRKTWTMHAGAGVDCRGRVVDETGAAVENSPVFFSRVSQTVGDVVYAMTDEHGDFAVRLPPGMHFVGARSRAGGVSKPMPVRPLPMILTELDAAATSVATALQVAALKRVAVPLAHVDAGTDPSDLAALDAIFASHRVVALGEATHGTSEFFRLKHRLLEYLVSKHGFRIFAIEASMAEARAINQYVLDGVGDPAKALRGLGFWTWDTTEVLAMIEWLRTWNVAHPDQKAAFHGFDMQSATGALAELKVFLKKVGSGRVAQVERQAASPDSSDEHEGRSASLAKLIITLRADLKEHQAAWEKATSASEVAWASRLVRVLEQLNQDPTAKDFVPRDRCMAENVMWLLDQAGANAKAVLWAHNAHLDHEHLGPAAEWSMGGALKETLGQSMYTLGFVFDAGQFVAIERGKGVHPWTVASLPTSLGAALTASGLPLAALDCTAATEEPLALGLLEERRLTWELGASFSKDFPPATAKACARFDGLLFVSRTTPAVHNPSPAR